jgi:predicted PurR-regulated permease PerM
MSEQGNRWGAATKRTVVVVGLVLLALVLYRFRGVIPPLAIAFLIAFILNPAVSFLVRRLRLSRTLATAFVFVALILVGLGVMAAPVTAVRPIQRAVRAVEIDLSRIVADVGKFFSQPIEVWEYTFDLGPVYEELSSMFTSFVGSVAEGTLDVVFGIASGAFWLVFTLIAAIYLVKDADEWIMHLDELAPPGYRDDFVRLRLQVTDVWSAFLRGQLLLGLAMVVITTVVCTAVGLPYALVMGLIAGVMEFIPSIGPVLALIPAVLVALVQGSNFLPLSNLWFAVLVLGLYLIIQQIEGNLLLPRILGRSVDLHPLVVLTGVIVGGSLAGVLGMWLAAPTIATLRVVGHYVISRLYDRDPFVDLEEEPELPKPGLLQRAGQAALSQLKDRLDQVTENDPSSTDLETDREQDPAN